MFLKKKINFYSLIIIKLIIFLNKKLLYYLLILKTIKRKY